MQHTVVAVCTGNICRSPIVERVLPTLLDDSVIVTSAGTQAAVGRAIDDPVAALLTRDGYRTAGFSARQLDVRTVSLATIILTMTSEHRDAVVSLVPSAARRTFTLLELVHLLRASSPLSANLTDDGARWAAIPDTVAAARHHLQARDLDIADPYRRSAQHYSRAYDAITQALTEIAQTIHPATAADHGQRKAPAPSPTGAPRRTPGRNLPGGPRHARR